MTLAKRIIPCLDVTAGRVVKGINFVELRDAGDPVEIARRYDEQGADEITFLDITASSDQRDLILRYYRGEDGPGESNIRNRQSLARDLELPMNALRIRVHRVRRKLESCVHASLRR